MITKSREAPELDWHSRMLLGLIRGEHLGRAKAIRRAKLLEEMRAKFDNTLTDSEMRVCKEMLVEANPPQPICSCSAGYFFAACMEDGLEERRTRRALAKDHLKKGKRVFDACVRLYGPQMQFPMGSLTERRP